MELILTTAMKNALVSTNHTCDSIQHSGAAIVGGQQQKSMGLLQYHMSALTQSRVLCAATQKDVGRSKTAKVWLDNLRTKLSMYEHALCYLVPATI